MSQVDDVLAPQPAAKRQRSALREATVRRVTGEGLQVTFDTEPGTHLHGPCTWSKPEGAPNPPAGTKCFVRRADTGRWVVVAFDGWPA